MYKFSAKRANKRSKTYLDGVIMYLDDFCEKHAVKFDSWAEVGVTARFKGYEVSFKDMMQDLDYNITASKIWEWYEYKAKNPEAEKEMNFYSFSQKNFWEEHYAQVSIAINNYLSKKKKAENKNGVR